MEEPSSEFALLEPQSRFGGKLLETWMVYPQSGTAALKGETQPRKNQQMPFLLYSS